VTAVVDSTEGSPGFDSSNAERDPVQSVCP